MLTNAAFVEVIREARAILDTALPEEASLNAPSESRMAITMTRTQILLFLVGAMTQRREEEEARVQFKALGGGVPLPGPSPFQSRGEASSPEVTAAWSRATEEMEAMARLGNDIATHADAAIKALLSCSPNQH